jgi:hypothetical protein
MTHIAAPPQAPQLHVGASQPASPSATSPRNGIHGGIKDALAGQQLRPGPRGYSIGPDGIVTVSGRQGRDGPARLVGDGRRSSPRSSRPTGARCGYSLPQNDPKYNDPVLGALITGGSWSVRMTSMR